MKTDLVQIASYATEIEANHIRSVLAGAGISAYVDGGAANTMLSYVGTALGGVRLLVDSAHANTARALIAALDEEQPDDGDWYCGECDEQVDAGFQVCWSCGKPRQLVQDESAEPAAKATPSEVGSASPVGESSDAPRDLLNPYSAPPQVTEAIRDAAADEPDAELEALVVRAYRAACIGFVLFPVLTHLYSMCLLIQASSHEGHLTDEGRRIWNRTFAIDLFAACFWAVVFKTFVG